MRFIVTYSILFIFLIIGCANNSKIETSHPTENNGIKNEISLEDLSPSLNYNLSSPSATFILDPVLSEISGLSYDLQSNSILAINDEKGFYYSLDPSDGHLISSHKFGKRGDYESIESTSDYIVIMKSSGDLYFHNRTKGTTEDHKTQLSAKNDLEGMAISQDQKVLLLACKGQPLANKKTKKEKSIYAFDLQKQTLITEAYLTIKDEALIDAYKPTSSKSSFNKITNRLKNFAPSGISVDHQTGDIYIISARGSILVIYSKEKVLKHVVLLNNKTNPQPEGICFDKEMNLYIATEGAGFSGKIFKYSPL